MSGRWILFVSARHFRTKRREKGHTAGVLSVAGIAAGVMTLIAVLAVMNGFQFGTIEDLLEIGSYHLQVDLRGGEDADAGEGAVAVDRAPTSDDAATGEREADEAVAGHTTPTAAADAAAAVPGVRSAVRFAESYGLVYGYFPDPLAVLIRAVPDNLLEIDERLAANVEVVSGRWSTAGESVVLGQELARRIGVRVGDPVEIVGFEGSFSVANPTTARLEVVGIFRTGFLEYDAGWAYVGLDGGAAQLGLAEADRIGIKLDDRFRDRVAARRLEAALPGTRVESWREFNRAIFGALRLEKTMMMLLVGLIFVVVGVNIYQSLRRSVVERTEEIGVLKAIGAPPSPLQAVFVLEGLWIGLAGAFTGLVLGLLVSFNINGLFRAAEVVVNALAAAANGVVGFFTGARPGTGGAFSLFSPTYFYIEEVPAVVVPIEVAGVVLFAVASATVAAWVASRRVSRIAPAEVLRYE